MTRDPMTAPIMGIAMLFLPVLGGARIANEDEVPTIWPLDEVA